MSVDEVAEGMRKCPFCAEIIRSEAKICRFCQRDLPRGGSEDSTPAGGVPLELRSLHYGARVSSPTMGIGTIVDPNCDGDSVRVRFDRDGRERTAGTSELKLLSASGPSDRSPSGRSGDETLITAAWLTALLLPPIGFVCGVILVAKGQVGHGVGAMIVSLLICFIWLAIFGAFAV